MRFGILALLCVFLTSCATSALQAPPPLPATPAPARATAADPRVSVEANYLRARLMRVVPQHTTCAAAYTQSWIVPAQAALARAGVVLGRPQLLVVVDRNPNRQELCILLARQRAPWQVIGGSRVSTGQSGRRGYFITPTGVFMHTAAIVDYRAEGTFNENHIRGLGLKGMRVWDFGWQTARKGWTTDDETGEIRLLLHATDPDYLEQRLGRPASKGCIRIPAAMNRFLDRYGVLDARYDVAARTNPRIAAVLPPDRQPNPLAGDLLVVIDSSPAA